MVLLKSHEQLKEQLKKAEIVADTYSIPINLSRFNEPQRLSIYQVLSILNSKISFWHIMTSLFRDSCIRIF